MLLKLSSKSPEIVKSLLLYMITLFYVVRKVVIDEIESAKVVVTRGLENTLILAKKDLNKFAAIGYQLVFYQTSATSAIADTLLDELKELHAVKGEYSAGELVLQLQL
ncbi:uncharacterized protein PHALS_11410 [Plasmopara halstedii]|uniref:Uncharacterized protein n=1 Tax=Plasmopara halstedii TaxID=4781 RepID=A0A0P1A4W9_PLAHL|nr:uncharacterized protein PHALS_11410 [Plasmopara halstedii]CEG35533.1 hypothetical protein PHALS_11410 [Plasmopara halstedii]|eukprot:XP_024571902.1 hypothetical protein PHALS_11410 [Plasmopara halstedii]